MSSAPKPTTMPMRRLLPGAGWPKLAEPASGILVDTGTLRLGVSGARAIALSEPFGSFGGLRLPRGLAIGAEGRLFLADPDGGRVLTALAGEIGLPETDAEAFRPLWSPPDDIDDPYRLVAPSDVAVGPRETLLIADPGAGRVLVIDWPSAVIRHIIARPRWTPTALAVDHADRLYVADPAGNTVHRFDAYWQRDPDFPHPGTVLDRPAYLALTPAASQGGGCECAVGCAPDPASDPEQAFLFVLGPTGLLGLGTGGRVVAGDPVTLVPPALQPMAEGYSYADPVYPARKPLLIRSRGLTGDGRIAGLALPLVAMARRIRVPRSGAVIFAPFDSGRRGFQWDRIAMDLTMPPRGSLIVEALCSDSPIPVDRIAVEFDGVRAVPIGIAAGDLPELLVQSGPGRFLWLKLSMICDGTESPEIHRIDIFGPRDSSINRLPAPFHQDPQSRDFLDRLLSYFDTIFAELRAANRETAGLFDPMAVPEGQWLNWLGSWFDLEFLAEWDIATRREMVAMAVEQARLRGTPEGAARMLRWHLGLAAPWPMMIEHFRLGPASPPLAHQPLPVVPEPHRVTIVLPRARVAAEAEPRLRRLLDSWLPAHVDARLVFIEPGLAIGRQSLLGIDTLLSGSTPQPLGRGRIGLDFSTRPRPAGAVIQTSLFNGAQDVR